jgi:hypothetical protein
MRIPPPNRRRGSAVVIMLALLAIVFVLANANSRNIVSLNRELHRMDERQVERWTTNSAAASRPPLSRE